MQKGILMGYTRINGSVNGNPNFKFDIEIDGDMQHFQSSSDSAFCYEVTNHATPATIEFSTTKSGRINYMKWVRDGATTNKAARGMANRNETRQRIREHVLSYFTPDMYDSGNPDAKPEENLHDQVKYMIYPGNGPDKVARQMVEGGTFLIYYGDQEKFINGLGLNPEGKKYDDQKVFDKYVALLSREIVHLYDAQAIKV